mgnify:FL=1
MLETNIREQIISLIRHQVVPAVGCTEPMAVALCVARAAELLGSKPEKVRVLLSANILKNAMGVGIPGTGMIGLPIAVALGIILADPSKDLTILENFSQEQLAKAKALVDKKIMSIRLKEGDIDKLYIEINLQGANHTASTIIQSNHRNIAYIRRDDEVLLDQLSGDNCSAQGASDEAEALQLTFDLVYEFATTTPLEKLTFIQEAARLNKAASEFGLKGSYGHSVGQMIQGDWGKKYLGNSALTEMLTYTSAACDARMDGAPVTVMSNSGSGNQGITATLPVLTFAQHEGASKEQTIRALVLSNHMVIYVKQKLGRLSALCGCVVAATGSSCGLTYLMGGSREQIEFSIKNMVGNITGMLCDGAKPSCSMKVSSGVSTAMFSALLAMEHKVVTSSEGIVDESVDSTISNLASIGRVGMNETDRLVLDIMTQK